ncbi:hypothetical protein T459_01234 [Capsicum annuum]|uniref:FAR1 domain-containing protein n=1 Tax=Capsicum annuum TaxID=4072 RepID=A0A2G3AGI3_CAPAN|nr:hypothetical protein T459_01234 [Capsicum annuum]
MHHIDDIMMAKEENAEGVGASHEEIENNMNAVVPFTPQFDNEETRVPYIGMEFQSPDIAYKFYLDYADRSGFSVRISRSRTDKSIIDQEFVCSKEGFRS